MIIRGLRVDGQEPLPPEQQPEVAVTAASPGYFKTMGIRIVRGRAFTAAESSESSPVALVSQGMARRLWGNADPVGGRLRIGRPEVPWTTVIGVVADVRQDGL